MTAERLRSLPVRSLGELPLKRVVAHGGQDRIEFCRVFQDTDFDAPCNFVDYAILPPGASIGVHRHGADEEIYLVLSGSGTMTRDGEEFAVGVGAVIVNRAGGEHGLRNTGDTPLRLFVVEIALAPSGHASFASRTEASTGSSEGESRL